MFKDFSALNQLAPDLIEKSIAQEVRNALAVESDLVGLINDSVSSYVDVYNRVRFTRINPDTRTPEDVTTTASNSAANSVLSRLRARLTERAQLLSVYKENISDSFSSTEIERDVQIAVPPLTVASQPTGYSGFVLAGHWLTVDTNSSDADIEEALRSLPLTQVVLSASSMAYQFSVAVAVFVAFGSFYVTGLLSGHTNSGSLAEHVDGDLHIGHFLRTQMEEDGAVRARSYAYYWRESTGTGAFFEAVGSSVTRTPLSGVTNREDAVMKMTGWTDVDVSSSYGTFTKTLIPRISTVNSVSKRETFTVSGADVVNNMFISGEAIESAISALADTQ